MNHMDRMIVKLSNHAFRVFRFMEAARQEVPRSPTVPTDEIRILRAKLIIEEALETVAALGVTLYVQQSGVDDHEEIVGGNAVGAEGIPEPVLRFDVTGPCDLVEVADGCCDVRVVTTGTLLACGIGDLALQRMIDDNNLAKFGPGSYRRDDGKWMKPPGHKKPDIRTELVNQGWKGE